MLLIHTLDVVIVLAKLVLVLCVCVILFLAADLTYFELQQHKIVRRAAAKQHAKILFETIMTETKAKVRAKKEAEAQEAAHFLPDDFISNFDHEGNLTYRNIPVPSEPNWEFYKKVDGVSDAEIFEKTKEL